MHQKLCSIIICLITNNPFSFQNLREGFNSNGRSKLLEKIFKEFTTITTIDVDLNTFIGLRKHMRAIHNKKPSQSEKDIEEYENNDRVEILASDLDDASKRASLSKMCKLNFHWTFQNEAFNSIHSPADEWFIEDFSSSSSACCFLPFALGSSSPKFLVVHLLLFPLSLRC